MSGLYNEVLLGDLVVIDTVELVRFKDTVVCTVVVVVVLVAVVVVALIKKLSKN